MSAGKRSASQKKPTAEKIASNDIRAALDLTLTEKIIT